MEKKINFHDYMEQQAADHNNLQDFARTSFDHLVYDAVTASRRYSGFNTVRTSASEVQIASGRFYDDDGAVYVRSTTTVQAMGTYVPGSGQRIILISCYGVEDDTETQTRDYIVDVETRRTEPQPVDMVNSRDVIIALTAGAQSGDPQAPAVPSGHAPIALVLMDGSGVVSVDMQTDYAITSLENLNLREIALEAFRRAIEPRISSIASDLAALAGRIGSGVSTQVLSLERLYKDVARLKEKAELPTDAADYGSDNFLNVEHTDADDSAGLGNDCKIANGLGFAVANWQEIELSLFSNNDANAHLDASGLVLPAFSSILKLSTGDKTSECAINQYGYTDFDLVQKTIHKSRLRYGPWWNYWWAYPDWYYYPYGLFPALAWSEYYPWILTFYPYYPNYYYKFRPGCWWETWDETYWELESTPHAITGAQVAQTFLVANDIWATKLGFYVSVKGDENIFLTLCEVTNGAPDLTKVILHQVVDVNAVVVGWNRVTVTPTFMKSGSRYAVVLTSQSTHKLGMTEGQNYLDGTFFQTTDTAAYVPDLTRDLMLEIWGAQFNAPQVTIEFHDVSLEGGVRNLDLCAGTVIPASTQLVYEVRPAGTSEWLTLDQDNLTALTGAPSGPTGFYFRGRFIGTKDVAPAIMLTGSRLNYSRPKQTFKQVSENWHLETASDDITVVVTAARFDETPHDLTCRLYIGAAYLSPNIAATDEVLDAANGVIRRTFHFTPSPATTDFKTVIEGTSTSAGNLFTVTDMTFWAV